MQCLCGGTFALFYALSLKACNCCLGRGSPSRTWFTFASNSDSHSPSSSMRMAVVAFLALSGVASADKCTGKPRTVSELREQWFGGPEHVWPRRNTTSYDKRTRPNLARRWVAHDINAEAGKPPEAEADPVWSVLQVRIDREGPSTSRGTGLRASSAAILIPNYHA